MDDLISRGALLAAYDKAHQGPPGGARKLIAEAPEAVVRCKYCQHWKPPHIRLNDGRQRAYRPEDGAQDIFGLGLVSNDVGINVGGKCWVDHNCGYGRDMRVFRREDEFCSRGDRLPEGMTGEQWWGLSEEPTELRDDFDY